MSDRAFSKPLQHMNGPNMNSRGHTRRKPRPRRNRPTRTSFSSALTNQNQITTAFFDGASGDLIHLPPPPLPATQLLPPPNQMLPLIPQPTYTHTATWKSKEKKEEEEFKRIRKQVKHIAPEVFKENASPFGEPCDIFPRNAVEWSQFKSDMYGMRADELEENAQKTLAMAEALKKIPKEKRAIKSSFGEDGKVFEDGLGPVLAQPTIWSLEHGELGRHAQAPWPTQAELLWNGDNRENKIAATRCGRYLPPPREPGVPGVPFSDLAILQQFPLDKTGPIFRGGPSPVEIQNANSEMNNNENFEEEGNEALGGGLMEEIGYWQPPFVPNWQVAQQVPGFDLQMAGLTSDLGGFLLYPEDYIV